MKYEIQSPWIFFCNSNKKIIICRMKEKYKLFKSHNSLNTDNSLDIINDEEKNIRWTEIIIYGLIHV